LDEMEQAQRENDQAALYNLYVKLQEQAEAFYKRLEKEIK